MRFLAVVGTWTTAIVALAAAAVFLASHFGCASITTRPAAALTTQPAGDPGGTQTGLVNALANLRADLQADWRVAVDAAAVRFGDVAGAQVDELRADVTGIESRIGQVDAQVAAIAQHQKAGRDIRINSAWPYVALAALLAPSPIWGSLCRWRRHRRMPRGPP